MTLKVPCPQCQTTVVWQTSSEFRPFCSKRCQLIDLGEWAEENHTISQNNQADTVLSEEMLDAMEEEFLLSNKFFVEPE